MTDRALHGRLGAQVSWARTVDRTERTANARRNSPSSIEWHLARLDPKFDGASELHRRIAAESAREAYFTRLAVASAKARAARRGAA